MEIKERTFVIVVPTKRKLAEFAVVKEVITEGSFFFIETGIGPKVRIRKDALIPLAQNCKTIQEGWQEHKPQIIMNLVLMIHDLQKQVSRLRSDSDNSAQALMKTQEKIRKHVLSPHH